MAQLWFVVALATALVAWQLFVPPTVGLADQGDFLKVLGPLGFAPVPKGPEHKYDYLTRTFVRDPSYRQSRWEQITSEVILAKVALRLHNLFGNPNQFDLTLFGIAHLVLFVAALARFVYVTRPLAAHGIIWALTLLVLTDVGYVAYWNSLYTEPASCLWFLFLLAESVGICLTDEIKLWQVLRWSIFAVLWITAKTQNAAFCVALAAYGLLLLRRIPQTVARYACVAGTLAICATGAIMYLSLLPAPRVMGLYDVIFIGILPESPAPQADLAALGLNPEYAQYSGTLPWSPHTGVADGALVNALLTRVNSFRLMGFYFARPKRMWRRLSELFPSSFSLRPEFCGNFERSARRPPGAKSNAIALWSWFHERCLAPVGLLLLATLGVAIVSGWVKLVLGQGTDEERRWTELGTCLGTCCLAAFFVAGFGEAWDTVKHMFVFNLLFDACLVFGVVSIAQKLTLRRHAMLLRRSSGHVSRAAG